MPSFKTIQPNTGSIHVIDGDPLDKAGAAVAPASGEIVTKHVQFGRAQADSTSAAIER